MTARQPVVRWVTGDGARARAMLAAALGIEMPVGDSVAMPGLRLKIAERRPGTWAADWLEVVAADPRSDSAHAAGDGAAAAGARFLALGWAIVDLDRVAAAWPGVRWAVAPRDSLVGARTLLGRSDTTDAGAIDAGIEAASPTFTTVLLEPDTEGRLAAALARHGEGPAALYVGMPAEAIAVARTRLARLGVPVAAGTGPFGPGIAIAVMPASSPTLIVVTARGPGVPGVPTRPDAVPSGHDRTSHVHVPGRRPGRRRLDRGPPVR